MTRFAQWLRTVASLAALSTAIHAAPARAAADAVTLLNVSYDPTRELYDGVNTGSGRRRPARR